MEKEKVRRYHDWHGPVISLGLGEHPWGVGVEAYRWAGGRWHEVDAIEVEFKAPEIGEAHFEVRHPIAYAAAMAAADRGRKGPGGNPARQHPGDAGGAEVGKGAARPGRRPIPISRQRPPLDDGEAERRTRLLAGNQSGWEASGHLCLDQRGRHRTEIGFAELQTWRCCE